MFSRSVANTLCHSLRHTAENAGPCRHAWKMPHPIPPSFWHPWIQRAGGQEGEVTEDSKGWVLRRRRGTEGLSLLRNKEGDPRIGGLWC